MNRTTVFIFFFSLMACAFAQSNDRIDELLRQDRARVDSAAYIILAAGGVIQETDGPDAAMEKAIALGMLKEGTPPDSPVRADEMSFMIVKSLSLKGGIMYSLFPCKRYAYRDLVFSKTVNGTGGPARIVSGEEVMRSLGTAMTARGGD